MDPAAFVFLDETGASTNMARHYGWGPRGERLADAAPHGHWRTTTFVVSAALRPTFRRGVRVCCFGSERRASSGRYGRRSG